MLRLAHPGGKNQITLGSALLSLCDVGMAVIGSPSIVEASNVVQKYDKANPEVFLENKDHMRSAMDSTRFSFVLD